MMVFSVRLVMSGDFAQLTAENVRVFQFTDLTYVFYPFSCTLCCKYKENSLLHGFRKTFEVFPSFFFLIRSSDTRLMWYKSPSSIGCSWRGLEGTENGRLLEALGVSEGAGSLGIRKGRSGGGGAVTAEDGAGGGEKAVATGWAEERKAVLKFTTGVDGGEEEFGEGELSPGVAQGTRGVSPGTSFSAFNASSSMRKRAGLILSSESSSEPKIFSKCSHMINTRKSLVGVC